jgi:hypothetical protein
LANGKRDEWNSLFQARIRKPICAISLLISMAATFAS